MSVLQNLRGHSGMLHVPLEVTEDADIGELFAVAVGRQGEQEGPLEAHEAPHTGQVETARVSQGCGRDGQRLAFRALQTAVMLFMLTPV